MIKGQVVSGDFSKVIIRVKAHQHIELGELVVIDNNGHKFLMQVYDLMYGSQISQQNLEMVSGMNLEEGDFQIMDSSLRNYQLAFCKPLLTIHDDCKTCKELPPFFAKVRELQKEDLSFITTPPNPLFLGNMRCGSRDLDFEISLAGKEVLSHHMLVAASTGKGKSVFMKNVLWNLLDKDYAGVLVLDPHDEYYGRVGLGLKDHPAKQKLSYYTPANPPPGSQTLKINLSVLKPEHFQGATQLSDPQRQCLYAYYRKFKKQWIASLLEEKRIEGIRFHEDTLAVVKRKMIQLLGLEVVDGTVHCNGIFDLHAGENTISQICLDLEMGKVVVIDTSFFSGAIEILVGSLITSEMYDKYRYYKKTGQLDRKPVISVMLEEAPRVLGKKVLEQGSNIFDTLAREGRKFHVGLIAITQIPSEIPKNILANMNTKVILGMEMNSERQAVIESAPQDLSQDNRTIASLDKGEAIVTSTFTRFAVPIKIPLFSEYVKRRKEERANVELVGFR